MDTEVSVILARSPDFSRPQFSHIQNGGVNATSQDFSEITLANVFSVLSSIKKGCCYYDSKMHLKSHLQTAHQQVPYLL